MAVDIFLKIEGVDGESKDEKHRDWIELESWSWGVQNSGASAAGGGGGAGKVSMQDFHFTKRIDKSTPKLFMRCANGEHIKSATIHVARNRNDKQTFMEYRLEDLLVSSYSPSIIGPESPAPTESFSLNFAKIEMVYREIDASTNQVIGEQTASYTIKIRPDIR